MPDGLATLPLVNKMAAGMSVSRNRLNGTGIRLPAAIAADYFALLKPRVMALAVFTAFVGMVMAPGVINPVVVLVGDAAIAPGAGAAGALNMWYDEDIDGLMSRTAERPIPSGRVSPAEALDFGLLLAALSVMTLGMLVGWLAASLLAFTIFFYVVVYTMWLKRSTPQNIVIGGAAGALPPVIGWAAATNAVGIESLRPVPDHLPVDAAAFLGARAVQGRRLRRGRHPDDAERRRRGLDAEADFRLCAAARAGRRAALGARLRKPDSRRGVGGSGRRFHLVQPGKCWPPRRATRSRPSCCSPIRSPIYSRSLRCCSPTRSPRVRWRPSGVTGARRLLPSGEFGRRR